MLKTARSIAFLFFLLLFSIGNALTKEVDKYQYGDITVNLEELGLLDNSKYQEDLSITGNFRKVTFLIKYDLKPGWHIYWRNPGQAGNAPEIILENNRNITILSNNWIWKLPERFYFNNLEQAGYLGIGELPYTVDFKLNKQQNTLEMKGNLHVLVCSKICIPVTKQFSFKFNPQRLKINKNEANISLQIPEFIEDTPLSANLSHDEGVYTLEILDFDSVILENKSLFIEIGEQGYGLLPTLTKHDDGIKSWRSRLINYDPLDSNKESLVRVTAKNMSGNPFITKVEIIKNNSSIFENVSFTIILLSLLAGIILNLMPCSFPILTMKAAQLLNRNSINRTYSTVGTVIGAILAALSIAFMLILLKKLGGQVGWGLHYQSPWITTAFAVLFVLFSISMFTDKVFLFFWKPWMPIIRFGESILIKVNKQTTRPNSTKSKHLNKEFLISASSAYAGFWIATPCGAPILGSIIVVSLLGNSFDLILNFTMVGIGMSLPYIAMQLIPMSKNVSKNINSWLYYLQKILAVIMMITAIWFALISFKQFDNLNNDNFQIPDGWEKFDESKLQILRAEGKTVLLHVTADWCLTCKVNYWNVYQSDEFSEFVTKNNIVLFWQDWTITDDLIRIYLAKHGRFSLPFDIVYNKDLKNKYIILPEILTFNSVKKAILPNY